MDGWGHGPLPVPFGYGGGLPSPIYACCPGCGLGETEIAHSSRVGCPVCYLTFPHLINALIWDYQGSTVHQGEVPPTSLLASEARATAYQEAIQQARLEGRSEDVDVLSDLFRLLHPENE